MNYDMQGMELIPELFAVLKAVKVEIKKEHQVLMVNKTTGFKKGKDMKGNFMNGKPVAAPVRKPKNQTRDEVLLLGERSLVAELPQILGR